METNPHGGIVVATEHAWPCVLRARGPSSPIAPASEPAVRGRAPGVARPACHDALGPDDERWRRGAGSYRWVTALAVDSVLFVLVWWLAESPVALDRGTALALAGFAAALVALPLGSWATRPVFAPHRAAPATATAPTRAPSRRTSWSARCPRGAAALVARAELLDELSRAHASGRIAVVSVLTGTRGVGKTQLAAAYARSRVEQGWPVVAWIPAEAEDQIVAGLAELGDLRGLRPDRDRLGDGGPRHAAVVAAPARTVPAGVRQRRRPGSRRDAGCRRSATSTWSSRPPARR